MDLKAAAGLAQLLSLMVFVTIAVWYVVPWVRNRGRADALIALLWVHALRHVALQVYSAQRAGFPISDSGANRIVFGDVTGMMVAMIAIVALRYRSRWSIPLVWLLVGETLFDTVANVSGGIREHLFGAASGVTWMVVSFYVPLLMVSVGLTVWQLYARRGEPLERSSTDRTWVSNRISMAR
jgi:hypothetical protein